MCIDDDETFSGIFVENDLLSSLESILCSKAFQRRFTLSSKPYNILISSFISALKTLDKSLDAWASRYRHFFALVFEGNPIRHEKDLHLSSTKLKGSFHVNKKTFEISMKQS
jgi:hypothetical protein